jgi:hypothetical protein
VSLRSRTFDPISQNNVTPRRWCSLSQRVKSTRSRSRGKFNVGAREQPTWRGAPAICRNKTSITSQGSRVTPCSRRNSKHKQLTKRQTVPFLSSIFRIDAFEMLRCRQSQHSLRNGIRRPHRTCTLKRAGPAPASPALATPAPKQYRSDKPSLNSVSRVPQSCPRP